MEDQAQLESSPVADDSFSRRAMLAGMLAAGAILSPNSARAAPSSDYKNVQTDFGAVGDGIADDTAAIQNAANSGASLFFPPGTYKLTNTITLPNVNGIVYVGAGRGQSIITQTTAGKDAFYSPHVYFRISWRELYINGQAGTGHGIRVDGLMYVCDFYSVSFYMGGSGVYAVNAGVFSTLFTRCDFSSHDSHAIEIRGGNTCVLVQCYAHLVPSTHYGYRIHNQALMLACNGIDSEGGWAMVGSGGPGAGDPAGPFPFNLVCIHCNVEGHTTDGLFLHFNGSATIINTRFLARPTGTYDSHIRVGYSDQLIQLTNCQFLSNGAVLSAGRTHPVSSPGQAQIKAINSGITEYQCMHGTVKIATEHVGGNEYLSQATILNSLKVSTLSVAGVAKSVPNALVLGNSTATNVTTGTLTPPTQVAGYLAAYLNGNQIRIPYYSP